MSDYKEFLDPGFQLHEKFKSVAPASLKHCINVANMCEAVAAEITGLDTDKLRLAAIYHDVGKIINPNHFIENQDGENPHDNLEPRISYQIITRHVSDSVALLTMYDFPNDVIKMVLEHHGSTVLKVFFAKSGNADDTNYRYKWNSPNSTEAAILMVCDVVEAASRSMFAKGKLNKEKHIFVNSVIDDLVEDDQLNHITVGDLKTIKRVVVKELDSLYHKRIEYPDGDKKED